MVDNVASSVGDALGAADFGWLIDGLKTCGVPEPGPFLSCLLHNNSDTMQLPPAGVLGDGWEAAVGLLASLRRDHARSLFRQIFLAQLANPGTVERLWRGMDCPLVDDIRGFGGIPYFIFGDSSCSLYERFVSIGDRWTAPMKLWSPGVLAGALDTDSSGDGPGGRILRWARGRGTCGAVVRRSDPPEVRGHGCRVPLDLASLAPWDPGSIARAVPRLGPSIAGPVWCLPGCPLRAGRPAAGQRLLYLSVCAVERRVSRIPPSYIRRCKSAGAGTHRPRAGGDGGDRPCRPFRAEGSL